MRVKTKSLAILCLTFLYCLVIVFSERIIVTDNIRLSQHQIFEFGPKDRCFQNQTHQLKQFNGKITRLQLEENEAADPIFKSFEFNLEGTSLIGCDETRTFFLPSRPALGKIYMCNKEFAALIEKNRSKNLGDGDQQECQIVRTCKLVCRPGMGYIKMCINLLTCG